MTLPERRGATCAHAILLMSVSLALLPAFVWTSPASRPDVNNVAEMAALRPGAQPVAVVAGGQFTRAATQKGLPKFLFRDGLPEYWGSCGGTIAINTSSMSRGELEVVRTAAADFAETASGPWTITTTTATAGTGSVVVVVVDPTLDRKGVWGVAHFSTSFGMDKAVPKFFIRISGATLRLSHRMAAAQSAALARAVTLHELAHVAGAGHNTSDPRALMAPRLDQAHLGNSVYTSAEAAGIRSGGSHACS